MTAPSLDADLIATNQGWRLRDRVGHFWALPTLSQPVVEAVTRLDGTHPLDRLCGTLSGSDRQLFDDLLVEFSRAGLLGGDDPARLLSPMPTVAVIGCGAIGSNTATELSALPLLLHLIDPHAPDPTVHGTSHQTTAAAAVRLRLLRDGMPRDRLCPGMSGGHWVELGSQTPVDLVVVTSNQVEVDRAITTHLTREGVPHLVVTAHRQQARVGPWVIPGSTACVGCIDRHHIDRDAAWPSVVARLCSRRAVLSPSLASWAATTVRSWIDDRLCRPQEQRSMRHAWGADGSGSVISFKGNEGWPQTRQWPPHPDCPCQRLLG